MNMLYEIIAALSDYLTDLDNNNGTNDYGEKVEFEDDFDFNNVSEDYIKIDHKTGRITSLLLSRRTHHSHDYDNVGRYRPVNIPPIIKKKSNYQCSVI